MLDLSFTPFPTLTTDRLVLRKITMEDAPELFFMRTDDRVMKYIERPRPKDISDTHAFITLIDEREKENVLVTWGIALKGETKLIGTVCFLNIDKDNHRSEIGYALHPDHWGKGVMNEVLEAVINYGFKEMKLHSICANINPENIASQKILEKNGFIREAYFKENFYWEGTFRDSSMYGLLTPLK